jgi:tRNA A-37 threonylcarbamoyl transferase component Bud32
MAVFHGEHFEALAAWQEPLAALGIAPGSRWETVSGSEPVAESGDTHCFRLPAGAGAVYFKRHVTPLRKRLAFWLRPARTTVEVYAAGRLHAFGIPTARVLAWGERRRLGMLLSSFIVTREVPGSMDLQRFALSRWRRLPPSERRAVYEELSSQLVRQLQHAHARRFFHQDLKWRNLLVRETAEGAFELYWIDAPRARVRRLRHRRGVILDLSGLSRLAVSLTSPYDRMRFIMRYLGPRRSPGAAARLFRAVSRHLARRPPRPPDPGAAP